MIATKVVLRPTIKTGPVVAIENVLPQLLWYFSAAMVAITLLFLRRSGPWLRLAECLGNLKNIGGA